MVLSTATWIIMLFIIAILWGGAVVAIWRSMRDEQRKLKLLQEQGKIDTYSPKALFDLRQWIETHPADAYADEAQERYNGCVETLREIEQPFYEWDDEEIDTLEKL